MKNDYPCGWGTLVLELGDITKFAMDVIVNAANSALEGGGGVDGAIHAAGGPAIMEECREIIKKIGRLEPGKAVITTGGKLPSPFVIHTVGPVWKGGLGNEREMLISCYNECLLLARSKGLRRIAFPSISTGAYGYPVNKASMTALDTVMDFLELSSGEGTEEVRFVLFSENDFRTYDRAYWMLKEYVR